MPQAIVDPDELKNFAHNLKRFNTELRGRMSHLQGQFSRLGETWRDQEHAKFAQDYIQTMRVLNNFIQESDAHIPFLLKKAQRAQDFLDQK